MYYIASTKVLSQSQLTNKSNKSLNKIIVILEETSGPANHS